MKICVVEEELSRIASWEFRGRPCRAGADLAVIFESGGVYRCTGARANPPDRLGTLDGGFSMGTAVEPCRHSCSCIFQGFWYCMGV